MHICVEYSWPPWLPSNGNWKSRILFTLDSSVPGAAGPYERCSFPPTIPVPGTNLSSLRVVDSTGVESLLLDESAMDLSFTGTWDSRWLIMQKPVWSWERMRNRATVMSNVCYSNDHLRR